MVKDSSSRQPQILGAAENRNPLYRSTSYLDEQSLTFEYSTFRHEMHDEMFLTTQGTIRFHIPGKPDVDAKVGDFVSVPVRAPHTFSNPFDTEAKFFNTYTPAFYINYFKLLGCLIEEGGPMTPEKNIQAMANYATLPVPREYLEKHVG